MKNLDLLIPTKATQADRFAWATTDQVSPFRLRLDGETMPLDITPDSLIDLDSLEVGDRIWCQLHGRRVLVLGESAGNHVAARLAALETPLFRRGTFSIVPVADVPTFLDVTFDTPFPSGVVPEVMLSADTTAPYTSVRGISATSVTNTGFRAWLTRTTTTTTGLRYLAAGF